ncbi:MAG: alanyl-tRNA editing protein [Candidatus Aminicenantes bacterium]|nr:alanyl-tRNA editing protein [Candidatus Aminicenantes bacterium]
MATTERLYFEDSGQIEFEAAVLERRAVEGLPSVVLDRTCFYPESGGQPWDLGRLGGVRVVRVIEEEGAILHVLEKEAPGESLRGEVDWLRRFDHMQQHSGQHILSQAFLETAGGETRSFHLGPEVSTLEIGLADASDETIDRVERRANEVVFEDREVRTFFVPAERIGEIPLRRPPKVEGTIRVVEVAGFDFSACGGTHVRRTGEIGLIKIIGAEKIRGNLRFTFVCGGRALTEFQVRTRVVRDLVGRFNVPPAELPGQVEKLAGEAKSMKKSLRALEAAAAEREGAELAASAGGDAILIRIFDDRGPEAVRALALSFVRGGGRAALFAARSPERLQIVLARAESLAFDLRTLVGLVAPLVAGKGGGGASLVEIAGQPQADAAAALERAAEAIRSAAK